MAIGFDFNKIKRKFMPVTLKDEQKVTLKTVKKKTYEKLIMIQQMDESTQGMETLDAFDRLVAEILSNNVEGKTFDADYVDEQFELDEKMAFIEVYMEYLNGTKNDPN